MDELLDTDFGLAGMHLVDDNALLGLDGRTRKFLRTAKAMANQQNLQADKGARAELLARFNLLPLHIKEDLKAKRRQVVDYEIYSTKTLTTGNKTLKVFEGQDTKQIGVRNLSNGKLEKDFWFLLSALQILVGPKGGDDYTPSGELPRAFSDGEFSLAFGKKTFMDNRSLGVFSHDRTDALPGFVKLTNPKLIEPQVEIEMDLDFASAFAEDQDIKVVFHGAAVIPF